MPGGGLQSNVPNDGQKEEKDSSDVSTAVVCSRIFADQNGNHYEANHD
jgi:hypothetical protein